MTLPAKKKEKIYTEQQELFLSTLPSTQGNIRQAMNVAGYSQNTPESYMINTLHEEIVEIANKLLAANSIKAASAIVDVLENPNAIGSETKLKAAEKLLDRVIPKKRNDDGDIKIAAGGGLVILPAKQAKVLEDIDYEVIE